MKQTLKATAAVLGILAAGAYLVKTAIDLFLYAILFIITL